MVFAMAATSHGNDCDLRESKYEGDACQNNIMCNTGCCKSSTQKCDSSNTSSNSCGVNNTVDYSDCPGILSTIAKLAGTALLLAIILPIVGCCLITCCIVGGCYYCCKGKN
jgi:hypothetical protein